MYGYHHNPMQNQHATGYDYGRGAFTGTNGLTVQGSSPAWPSPDTSGETMDKINAWLDKAPIASYPSVKNKHLAIGGAVLAVGGLAWYGSKHRWF
jgi:hypothetical protein